MSRARSLAPVLALLVAALLPACSGTPECPANTLTTAERDLGWELLFDGESLEGWHLYGREGETQGWEIVDGTLARTGGGGDLVTEGSWTDFELRLEWRISEGGNSGIFFRVGDGQDAVWRTGPEMQVLDNERHADGRNGYTSAGANYALHAPPRDATREVGEWNQVHILVRGNKVEYWLNTELQCSYELQSEAWEELVAASKFASMPLYGREPSGRIALQDHGDLVWYRSIKIRALE